MNSRVAEVKTLSGKGFIVQCTILQSLLPALAKWIASPAATRCHDLAAGKSLKAMSAGKA